MLNLFLALVWLCVGIMLLIWQGQHPDSRAFTLGDGRSGISAGWVCLVLTPLNLIRWWSGRRLAARQKAQAEEEQRQWLEHRRKTAGVTPDPNLVFTDEPAQKDGVKEP
jgi:hypothetical protein